MAGQEQHLKLKAIYLQWLKKRSFWTPIQFYSIPIIAIKYLPENVFGLLFEKVCLH